ncbi:uncharacterized protein BJX67DRAFT_385431 [Aspergillus lucknowensis]|uniref:Uncharacterized protein n=1 Tax=Aspergillus lucknowensis TaxID=176173 RepID=A0ABR4LDL2_9EURO
MEGLFNDLAGLPFSRRDDSSSSLAGASVDVLDWVEGVEYPSAERKLLSDLAESRPSLRVIITPVHWTDASFAAVLGFLIRHYRIPTAFIEAESRAVTHAFGSLDTSDGYRCCWFNFLCKNITVQEAPESGLLIRGPSYGVPELRQSDLTWIRSGFFLRWPIDSKLESHLTLISFGCDTASQRLRRISLGAVRDGVLRDPLSLFVVILHELSAQMDRTVWDLSDVFRGIEWKAMSLSRDRESFTGLHNISKHIIYLQEGSDAVLMTVEGLSTLHDDFSGGATIDQLEAVRITRRTIAQVESEFQTIKLRVKSLDRRMQNVIALSFHLVTQEGNTLLQSDSNTMATIAFVTLVFLPITTVSTVFGSQFFNTSPGNTSLEVSNDFWIFWVVSIPLTLAVLLGWSLWRKQNVNDQRAWKSVLGSFLGRGWRVGKLERRTTQPGESEMGKG